MHLVEQFLGISLPVRFLSHSGDQVLSRKQKGLSFVRIRAVESTSRRDLRKSSDTRQDAAHSEEFRGRVQKKMTTGGSVRERRKTSIEFEKTKIRERQNARNCSQIECGNDGHSSSWGIVVIVGWRGTVIISLRSKVIRLATFKMSCGDCVRG